MDYTLSNSYATDAGTTQRMHVAAQAVPTAVSDADMNMLVWELMEIVKAGGQVGAPFDKAVPATYQKLLAAMRAAGVFTTAPQFDNTTRAATTAFLRAQGLQGSGLTTVAVTSTLTAAVVGGTVLIASASATTQTLPAANAVPAGARIELMNTSTGIGTVSRAGTDTLIVNNTSVTTLALGVGDTLTLASNGVNGWLAVGGSVTLRYASGFFSVLGTNGYKRTPDQNSPTGYIIDQWGTFASAADSTTTVTLPIGFPNVFFGVNVTVASNTGLVSAFPFSAALPLTLATFSLRSYYNASSIASFWTAKGY